MDVGLDGKVALVTGASRGIGFAVAKALAREGAWIAVSSSSAERIAVAAEKLGASAFVYDSEDPSGAARVVAQVERDLGPVEILVVNTGGPPAGADPFGFQTEEWQRAHRRLVLSPMELIEATLPSMQERGWGRIVNIASTAVREPIPNLLLSSVHRVGALAAFKTIAKRVAGDGITVNTVLPGRVATQRLFDLYGSREEAEKAASQELPIGRLCSPDEFAAVVTFVCSRQASYLTGEAVTVDGGLTRSL